MIPMHHCEQRRDLSVMFIGGAHYARSVKDIGEMGDIASSFSVRVANF